MLQQVCFHAADEGSLCAQHHTRMSQNAFKDTVKDTDLWTTMPVYCAPQPHVHWWVTGGQGCSADLDGRPGLRGWKVLDHHVDDTSGSAKDGRAGLLEERPHVLLEAGRLERHAKLIQHALHIVVMLAQHLQPGGRLVSTQLKGLWRPCSLIPDIWTLVGLYPARKDIQVPYCQAWTDAGCAAGMIVPRMRPEASVAALTCA